MRSSKSLSPDSAIMLCRNLEKFQFEGDQTDILHMLHNYAINNQYYFTPDQYSEFIGYFKKLVLDKAYGPIEFVRVQRESRHVSQLTQKQILDLNGIDQQSINSIAKLIVTDSELSPKISFEIQNKGKPRLIKILGFPARELQKIDQQNLNPYQHNSRTQQILSKFLTKFRKEANRNLQSIIIHTKEHILDKGFLAECKEEQLFNCLSPRPIELHTETLREYLVNFERTRGLLYNKLVTSTGNEPSLIDPYRSLLLHLSKSASHQKVHLLNSSLRKVWLGHYLSPVYSLQNLREHFAYLSSIHFHEQLHFTRMRQNSGCLDQNTKEKGRVNCQERQKYKLRSLFEIDGLEGRQRGLLSQGKVLGEEIWKIVSAGQDNSCLVVVRDYQLWDVFRTILKKHNPSVDNRRVEAFKNQQLHRIAILNLLFGSENTPYQLISQDGDKVDLRGLQRIQEGYEKILYPVKLYCQQQ